MDRQEAERLVNEIRDIPSPTEEEIFLYTDALNYLIEKTGKPEWMMELGGYYYEEKRFDLALKYYEMAAAKNDTSAFCCLGYIWYYGRTGERDFEKAFENKSVIHPEDGICEMFPIGFDPKKNVAASSVKRTVS